MYDLLVGNERLKETVKSMITSGRIPHAIIIDGEDGFGKHTLASIIAAAANCEEMNPPCGKCRTCDLIRRYAFVDMEIYSPDGATFKVDTIRKIRASAYIKPNEARRKIFVLEHCELMNEQAQNALLKILEEPPGTAIFILLMKSSSQMLPTIRSRTVTLSLLPPTEVQAEEYIKKTTEFDSSDIKKALIMCDNNIGKTLEILKSGSIEIAQNALDFAECVMSHQPVEALKVCRRAEGDRLSIDAFLSELSVIFRKKISTCAMGAVCECSQEDLIRIIGICDELIQSAAANCNKTLLLTALHAKLFDV